MDLLRFSTAGSVDDGKSTLIGRLLFDSKGIFEDQLDAARRATRNESAGEVDLSLLTDGLKAEREQGITIDVAYRYFATPRRKFIIADTPGHEQYTRNMATGASTADLAIILVDARHGVLEQSRRHTYIAHLLGIPELVVAVNKMDLVDYDQLAFESIKSEFQTFAAQLGVHNLTFIPISALKGDNVVHCTEAMPWYTGPALLDHLEGVEIDAHPADNVLRFPVQMVLRPNLDFRAFAGQVSAGTVKQGDTVVALPSGKQSRIKRIHTYDGALQYAHAPMSVALQLEDEIDISRGDMLVAAEALPRVSNDFEAELVWMSETPLDPHRPYLLKHTTQTVRARVTHLVHRTDVNTLEHHHVASLALNEIGRVRFSTSQPLFLDPYVEQRTTGSFVLIDLQTNTTVAAGMVAREQPPASPNVFWSEGEVTRAAREASHGHKGAVVWLTGLPCAGKSSIATVLEQRLFRQGVHAYILNGKNLRHGLSGDLDFSPQDRSENLRRAAEVATLLVDAGVIVIGCFVSPFAVDRERVRSIVGAQDFLELYVSTPPAVCELRDRDELYRKARAGEISGFTGVDAPYEAPANPDLVLPNHELDVDGAVERILALLNQRGVLRGAAILARNAQES